MKKLLNELNKKSFVPFVAMALTLGLAPFSPPHIIEKLQLV
jgi:hypothetical protein